MVTTLVDRITLVPALGIVVSRVLLATVKGLFQAEEHNVSYRDYVFASVLRGLFTVLTIGQLQYVNPLPTVSSYLHLFHLRLLFKPFIDSYKAYCKKNQLQPIVEDIPNTDIKGFWLGSKDSAQYSMVFYHGGGFVLPGLPLHVDMLARWVEWSNGRLAIFCPCYTLAPEGVYPLQIAQSVEALRHVLSLPHRSPESVLLGGDSAGGNLVLAVLSHVSGHPHPQDQIVRPLEIPAPLKGAITIAPWVSTDDTKFKSMQQLADIDCVNSTSGRYWIAAYRGSGVDDQYIAPELASPGWWSGCRVSSFLTTTGNCEFLRDSVVDTARKVQQGAKHVDFKLVVAPGELHDAPLTPKPSGLLDQLGDACQEGAIRKWIKSRLL